MNDETLTTEITSPGSLPETAVAPALPLTDPLIGPSNPETPGPVPGPVLRPAMGPVLEISSVLGKVKGLSDEEQKELATFEAIIFSSCQDCFEVGRALTQIQEKGLFRTDFRTFAAYYRVRWGFEHTRAYNLMAAAQVQGWIATMPSVLQPEYEAHLRPLFGLEPEAAKKAWQAAVEKSNGGRITASLVKRVVRDLGLLPPKPAKAPNPRPNRKAQRQTIALAMGEYLKLLSDRAPHTVLLAKFELLHGHVEQLFQKR